jgi:hypothetical protein
MNALRPLPRPVEVAFPPNATVIAVRTALLPPTRHVKEHHTIFTGSTYFHYGLRGSQLILRNIAMLRTNDEVDLRTESERKKLVAHELVHLDRFNNAKFRGALSVGASESEGSGIGKNAPPVVCSFDV